MYNSCSFDLEAKSSLDQETDDVVLILPQCIQLWRLGQWHYGGA